MLLVETEVKSSPIAQHGLFAKQPIRKGAIIGFLTIGVNIINENQYQDEQRKGNQLIIKTGARYAGRYFLYKNCVENEEYFNHSCEPNVLYHCGICFALRDINIGEELTINYQYLFAKDDATTFFDTENNRQVNGLEPSEALLQSAHELIQLLKQSKTIDQQL